jgi:hypothetical protein
MTNYRHFVRPIVKRQWTKQTRSPILELIRDIARGGSMQQFDAPSSSINSANEFAYSIGFRQK